MLRSVRSECSRGSSLRSMVVRSDVREESFYAAEETAGLSGCGRFLHLSAHAVIQEPKRRMITGVAQIFAHPVWRLAEMRRHAENFRRRLGDAGEFRGSAG